VTRRAWLHWLFARPKSSPVRRRPRVEAPEVRRVPAAYHATGLFEGGSAGTLRDAISQATAYTAPTPSTPISPAPSRSTAARIDELGGKQDLDWFFAPGSGSNADRVRNPHASEVLAALL
jgi:hypothetical protein